MELFVDIKKKLKGFSLNIKFEAGSDALALLGASGSGKSMTLRCIAGLEKPDKGKIILNGRVLFDSEKGINIPCRKRRLGFLFQNYALFPNMTVEENIGFALEGLNKSKRNCSVQENIKMVKLEGLEKRYPYQLSGGQQQRVALARALAIEPEALLLDEPFSALDDYLRNLMVKQLMDTLSIYHGVTLFVSHNIEDVYKVCNKLVVLVSGNVEAKGEKDNIFQMPPTFTTAQLTGCKNFSCANYLSENTFDATDWDVELKTSRPITKELKHVGIRTNYIRLASENETDNTFNCWPSFTLETPFRITVYLSIGKKPSDSNDYQLQWEISKERWFELQDLPFPWRIYLDPDKLIILYN